MEPFKGIFSQSSSVIAPNTPITSNLSLCFQAFPWLFPVFPGLKDRSIMMVSIYLECETLWNTEVYYLLRLCPQPIVSDVAVAV
jgi:hypothetical protein